jgi:hypothetical protein
VDYFNIAVDEAIAAVGTDTILNSCYPSAGGSSQFCDRINRFPGTGEIDFINDPQSNVGGDKTAGMDFNFRYQPQTSFGRVGLSLDATWLHKFDRRLASGNIVRAKGNYDLGVYSDWKATLGLSWANGPVSAASNIRWINGFKECQDNSCTVQEEGATPPPSRQVSDYYATDLNVAYDWEMKAGTATAQLGVNNVFDAKPAYIANGFTAGSDPTAYDYLGRYFYMRLSYNYY